MRGHLCVLLLLLATTAHAEIIFGPATKVIEWIPWYDGADRIISLEDGSRVLLYEATREGPQPHPRHALLVSADGRHADAAFRLEIWIPNEIKEGTFGQIFSVAQSLDRQRLAFTGGWHGAGDDRGHNGVFVLRRFDGDLWQLESWFDVRGVPIAEIEFGANGTLLVPTAAAGTGSGELRVYDLNGRQMGTFLELGSSPHSLRFARMSTSAMALYDPDRALVRILDVSAASVTERRTIPIPFGTERVTIPAFTVDDDGATIARTFIDGARLKTIITVLRNDGSVADERQTEEGWRYGFARNGVLHGFAAGARGEAMRLRTVTVR